jgi:hypothetical protein
MSATVDAVLESLLGRMESPIPRAQLTEPITNRIHGGLTSDQSIDAAEKLTSDLTLILHIMWMKRTEESEKEMRRDYDDKLNYYKDRIKELKADKAPL